MVENATTTKVATCSNCSHDIREHTGGGYDPVKGLSKTRCAHYKCTCMEYHDAESDKLKDEAVKATDAAAEADAEVTKAKLAVDTAKVIHEDKAAIADRAVAKRDSAVNDAINRSPVETTENARARRERANAPYDGKTNRRVTSDVTKAPNGVERRKA